MGEHGVGRVANRLFTDVNVRLVDAVDWRWWSDVLRLPNPNHGQHVMAVKVHENEET